MLCSRSGNPTGYDWEWCFPAVLRVGTPLRYTAISYSPGWAIVVERLGHGGQQELAKRFDCVRTDVENQIKPSDELRPVAAFA